MINRNDFVREYASLYGVTIEYAKTVCDSVFELLGQHVIKNQEDVSIHRFGSFRHKPIKEHYVKHPITGEPVLAGGKDKIQFFPAACWSEYDEDEDDIGE